MTLITAPLREEHRGLLPAIEDLRTLADTVGELPAEHLRQRLSAAHAFLSEHLMIHAQAEEAVLYPQVAALLGAPDATATMARDHAEIAGYIAQVGALRDELTASDAVTDLQIAALRRILYGLYAIIKLHFAKEEEVYLPLLDTRLTTTQAQHFFANLERAAHDASGADIH